MWASGSHTLSQPSYSFVRLPPFMTLQLFTDEPHSLVAPIVLWAGRNRYSQASPQKSNIGPSLRVFREAARGHWSLNLAKMYRTLDWNQAKPSNIDVVGDSLPAWCQWDDRTYLWSSPLPPGD